MKHTPLGDRVLVKVDKPDLKDKRSGIVIAETSINPTHFIGEVLGIGPSFFMMGDDETQALKVGDRITFLKYGYEDLGDDLYLVEERSLLTIIEE